MKSSSIAPLNADFTSLEFSISKVSLFLHLFLNLVPKLLAKPNQHAHNSLGDFIVNVTSVVYVWITKNCDPLMYDSMKLAACQVIRYERQMVRL